jgi:hypothetical protein
VNAPPHQPVLWHDIVAFYTKDEAERCGYFVGNVIKAPERPGVYCVSLYDKTGLLGTIRLPVEDLMKAGGDATNPESIKRLIVGRMDAVLAKDLEARSALPLRKPKP